MNRIEFLTNWYYKEEQRSDTLDSALNIPLIILSGYLAGFYFLVTNYDYYLETIFSNVSFLLIGVLFLFFFVRSIFWFVKSYTKFPKNYTYKAFPTANFIEEEYNNLKPYYEDNKDKLGADTTLDKLVENNVELILVDCIERNVFNNDEKTIFLYKSKRNIVYCTIILVIFAIFVAANNIILLTTNIL